jgi:uncharacterized protein
MKLLLTCAAFFLRAIAIFAAAAAAFAPAAPAFAQQIPFPLATSTRAATDPAALEQAMPALAKEAIAVYRDENRARFFGTLLRLQIVSGDYGGALASVASFREARLPIDPQAATALLIESIVAQAKREQAQSKQTFETAYRKAFEEQFGILDDKRAHQAEFFFDADAGRFERDTKDALNKLNSRKEDTVALNDALDLLRKYQLWTQYRDTLPLSPKLIAEDDAKRYVIATDTLIKTPEGATLSAVVVRKKGVDKPKAAALFVNIYTSVETSLREAKFAAARGYVGVVSDVRGKRLSPDPVVPYEHDAKDVRAVIDWVAKQSWNDGRVVMWGGSYTGFAAWASLKNPHPALKAIAPYAAVIPGQGLPMENNIFILANYGWPFYVGNNKFLDEATYNNHERWRGLGPKWFATGRAYREVDKVDGTPNPMLQKWLKHPSFDKYWQDMVPYGKEFARIDIPVLSVTGYYDDSQISALQYVKEHFKHHKNPNHTLLIGPYDHGTTQARPGPMLRGYQLDPVARIDVPEITFQWFDHVLDGAPKPALLKDRINYQVMGANEWRHAPSLDKMAGETLTLYLSNAKLGERYALATAKPAQPGHLAQTVDFADRKTTQNDYYPFPIVGKEPDFSTGFTFVSEPFDKPVSVEGVIEGVLNLTINKRDVDLGLNVYELMPDGKLFQITYFIGRASYAEDMSRRKLLTPGKKTAVPFDRVRMGVKQLGKGSRLLIAVNVNKDDSAQVNYGTGKDVSDETVADGKTPLQVKWHNDSYVKIPIRR